MDRQTTLAGGLAQVLLALVLATGCGGAPRSTAAEEAPPLPPAVNVAVQPLELTTLTERIQLSGRIEPWVEVRVSSELGGRVDAVGFDKGQRVPAGHVLARVGADLHQAALAEAEAALAGAEATWERTQRLFERQAVPRQNLITATAQHEVAKAQVAQARLRLERSIIRAPVAGVAVTRDLEPGEVLAPGAPVTTLHRLDRVKATVGIPENDVSRFRVGGAATIRVDSHPDREFEGRIHFLAPSASGPTRTFTAEIAVENPGGELRPGMIARMSLVRRQFDDVIVVPRDALQERDAGSVAIVADGAVARVRAVRLGAFDGDRVVVEEGLAAGERLVVAGHRGLMDGQRIQVVERLP